jgi:FMN phosphatase YigB (HAD superfamily)
MENTMRDELVRHTGLSQTFIERALIKTEKRLKSYLLYGNLNEIEPLKAVLGDIDFNQHFAEVAAKTKAAYYDALKPPKGTIELLDELRARGKSIYVYTASTPAKALEKLEGAGLTNRFDKIFSTGSNAFEDSAESGLITKETTSANLVQVPYANKVDSRGYQWILNHLNTQSSRVAMTGDHAIEDVAYAKSFGILTAQAKWYFNEAPKHDFLPDLELTSPKDLTDALRAAYAQVRQP